MAETARFNAECIEYLGRVSEMLRTGPSGKTPYGDFYISEVKIVFDNSEQVGRFIPDEVDGKTYQFIADYEIIDGE